MSLLSVLQTLGLAIIASGLVGFVARSLITHFFNKDLETYKANLQREQALSLAQLERAALEHQVRFTRLHETRAEVIAGIYRRLAQAQRCFEALVSPFQHAGSPDTNDRLRSAQDAGNEFIQYFDENQIYLDKDTCQLIAVFNEEMRNSFITFWVFVVQQQGQPTADQVEKWSEAWKILREKVPPIRKAIEDKFREMLE